MKQVITVCAPKGGTAKTATAGSLAEAAARDGQRTLIIDADPQSDLTLWYAGDLKKPGSYEIITGKSKAADAIQNINAAGFDMIAGNANLTALTTSPGSAQRLFNALKGVRRRYDFIVIDCGPGMNEALNNALFASDGVIIPLESEANSLQALYAIMDIIDQVKQTRAQLKIKGVVITKYDQRPKVNRLYYDGISDVCDARNVPFLGAIRSGVAVREAMATKTPLFEYAPKSKPAADYLSLYEKIKGAEK